MAAGTVDEFAILSSGCVIDSPAAWAHMAVLKRLVCLSPTS